MTQFLQSAAHSASPWHVVTDLARVSRIGSSLCHHQEVLCENWLQVLGSTKLSQINGSEGH
jgi:hypothetical protein